MTIKATFTEAGVPSGFWPDSENYPDGSIPESAIEISEDIYIALVNTNGSKVFLNGVISDAPVVAVDLATLQASKLAEINAASQNAVDALVSTYPQFEQLTWSAQQTEASAWFTAVEADRVAALVPWCSACATARGIPLADFMALVKANVDAFIAASATIAGKRQALATAIYSVEDTDDGRAALAAIKWE